MQNAAACSLYYKHMTIIMSDLYTIIVSQP
jgi:hypothetical protein